MATRDQVLDRSLAGLITPTGVELWGTYTAVETAVKSMQHSGGRSATTAAAHVWYIAFAFEMGKPKGPHHGQRPTIQLLESDLAPMIDGTAMMAASSSVGSFSAIPTGAFLGAGAVIKGETAYVVWTSSDFLAKDGVVGGAACGTVTVSAWQGSRNVTVEPQGTLAHLAPVLVGGGSGGPTAGAGMALLGEAGKVTPVSTYRFESISGVAGGVRLALRGKPEEKVALLYAVDGGGGGGGGWECRSLAATIGSDGTGAITLHQSH